MSRQRHENKFITFVFKSFCNLDAMVDIRQALRSEGNFGVSMETIDEFLMNTEELCVPPKTAVIRTGTVNTNVYVIKEGILKMSYLNDIKEITYGFGGPGSLLISPHSFYMNKPAFMQVETCKVGVTLLYMGRDCFYRLMESSPEFSRWMFNIATYQLLACEMKLSLINGTAKERYLSMIRNRPEILRFISKKDIASYLGVTPEYLSRISADLK